LQPEDPTKTVKAKGTNWMRSLNLAQEKPGGAGQQVESTSQSVTKGGLAGEGETHGSKGGDAPKKCNCGREGLKGTPEKQK